MANLIITIISIALIAIAALMGAYYGGAAFLNGQAKANADALIGQAEQDLGAWAVYATDRGGSWNLSSISGLSNVTPQAYLQALPISPAGITNSASPPAGGNQTISTTGGWNLANLSDVSAGTAANYNGIYMQLTDDTTGASVCQTINQMIGGSSLSVFTAVSVSNNLMANTSRKFDCVTALSTAASTVSAVPTASANPKYVYYRAY